MKISNIKNTLKNYKKFISLIFLLLIFNIKSDNTKQIVFTKEPVDFKPKLEVATCYIIYNQKILFLKRCAKCEWDFTWGPPGGKIEKNQTPYNAMLREVFEETGIDASKEGPKFLQKFYVKDPKKDFIYHTFIFELDHEPKIVLCPNEHTDYIWLSPKQALEKLNLIPGEDECLKFNFLLKQD